MSAVVHVPAGGDTKKIYFIYNFKQVNDFIVIVMFNETVKQWQQFIIHYIDGKWETDVLSACTNDETFKQICWKLESVFDEQASHKTRENISCNEIIVQDAEFLLDLMK